MGKWLQVLACTFARVSEPWFPHLQVLVGGEVSGFGEPGSRGHGHQGMGHAEVPEEKRASLRGFLGKRSCCFFTDRETEVWRTAPVLWALELEESQNSCLPASGSAWGGGGGAGQEKGAAWLPACFSRRQKPPPGSYWGGSRGLEVGHTGRQPPQPRASPLGRGCSAV